VVFLRVEVFFVVFFAALVDVLRVTRFLVVFRAVVFLARDDVVVLRDRIVLEAVFFEAAFFVREAVVFFAVARFLVANFFVVLRVRTDLVVAFFRGMKKQFRLLV